MRVLADSSTYSLKLAVPSDWRTVSDGNPMFFATTRAKGNFLRIWVYQRPTPDVPLSLRLYQLKSLCGKQLNSEEKPVPAGTMLTVTTDEPLVGYCTAWLVRTETLDVLAFCAMDGTNEAKEALRKADAMVRGLRIDPLRPKP